MSARLPQGALANLTSLTVTVRVSTFLFPAESASVSSTVAFPAAADRFTATRRPCVPAVSFPLALPSTVDARSNRAFAVTHLDGAQLDLFDDAGDAVDPREIADAHLIFEDQKEPGDDVAHQILRAESDRQAGNARAQDQGAFALHHIVEGVAHVLTASMRSMAIRARADTAGSTSTSVVMV